MAQGYTKDQPLDTDVNLGGGSPLDYVAASQKATKTYVDNKLATQDIVEVSKLVAADGSPDPALAADNAGDLSTAYNLTLSGASKAIKGTGSNVPDLGTTTAAEKIGNVYQGDGKDTFADNDSYAIFNRLVNYGYTPDEHWGQNSDELAWTGWAAYTGFATPSIISTTNSIYRVANAGATKAFRYRAAATGNFIYLRSRLAFTFILSVGLMIDDGVNNVDGNGADNFYRAYITQAAIGGAVTAAEQYRSGGGAVTTNATTFTLTPHLFYGLQVFTTGTRWTNWTAQPALFGESGERVTYTIGATGLTWTPARVGLYMVFTAVDASRKALYDWYDESVS